ncbi:MAG: cysteine-rich CWC family protein [Burkholderiaceae bacterium]|nr:cysteine-rich CWC family protein [Burkholderiaceae bacterium]MDO9090879.1 cysteine-rich CWC family protein [Burkholderiaceae bacterium]MDP1968857.1 cysteine-rich CWC family protein [Burkholderiaceae bacterium]
MSTSTPSIDTSLCPLCGGPNGCAQVAPRAEGAEAPPCWCMNVRISPQALARLPAAARRRACICQACATEPSAEPASGPAA